TASASRSACSSIRASFIASRSRERKASRAWAPRLGSCVARWSIFACANSSRACAGMSKEPTKPSETLVQELLAERRELKVAVERLRLELEDARRTSGGPNPRLQ